MLLSFDFSDLLLGPIPTAYIWIPLLSIVSILSFSFILKNAASCHTNKNACFAKEH